MFAVIKTGGKQYKVSEGDVINIEKLAHKNGAEFDFDEVLMVGNGSVESTKLGSPLLEGAKVSAKIIEEGKAKKKIVFKYTNKTRYRKKKGHRQPYTKVQIIKITV